MSDPAAEPPVASTAEAPAALAPQAAMAPASQRERISAGIWMGLGLALVLAFFYFLAPILAPFALGGVLAYLLLPGANRLQRLGVPRSLASVLMVLLCGAVASGLVLILLPMLEREALALQEKLPRLITQFNTQLAPLLEQQLGVSVHLDPAALRAMAIEQAGNQDLVTAVLTRFGSGGLAVLQVVFTLVLVPMVLFYLLADAPAFTGRLEAAIPRRWHAQTMQMLGEIDAVLAQFLRGQLTVMLVLAVYYSAALAIAGFDSALAIGLVTGLLIFIPYVGFTLGLVLAALAALLQFPPWQAGLSLAIVYGIGNVVEGFFLTPRLVGGRIGLHPLGVIFALLAFGHVFGFFGVLVALPASAVLVVALRRIHASYVSSAFYNRP